MATTTMHIDRPLRVLLAYFAAACLLTWSLAAPMVSAMSVGKMPTESALGLAGLSALGPLLAALLVARFDGGWRGALGRYNLSPWIAVALLSPTLLHLCANAIATALGFPPSQWLFVPSTPEHVAALVMFSLGEEPGWRGFAQPRAVRRFGPVAGPLLVGFVWGLWHLLYSFGDGGSFDSVGFGLGLVELSLFAVIFVWMMQRGGGSMWVAIALHAGGHLDNVHRSPAGDLPMRLCYVALVALVALWMMRQLRQSWQQEMAPN